MKWLVIIFSCTISTRFKFKICSVCSFNHLQMQHNNIQGPVAGMHHLWQPVGIMQDLTMHRPFPHLGMVLHQVVWVITVDRRQTTLTRCCGQRLSSYPKKYFDRYHKHNKKLHHNFIKTYFYNTHSHLTILISFVPIMFSASVNLWRPLPN